MPKLGLIAGGGALPGLVIDVCRAQNRPLHVIALKGHADPKVIGDTPADWIRLGEAASGIARLKQAGVSEVVMIGPVRRPSVMELAPDLKTAALVARIGLKSLGDDGLLRSVVSVLEAEGLTVIGIDRVLEDCLAPAGLMGQITLDDQARQDVQRGIAVAKAMGRVDVGQSVVVQQGVVLGVEAIEGTDQMIRRTADLQREGVGGVLVKISKPGQDRRIDLPTIGITTLMECRAAGLRGIAVEAQGTLMMGRQQMVTEADHLGMFLFGVDLDES